MQAEEHTLRFGPFRLVPGRRALLCGDQTLPLRGRPFDLLAALVERRHRVVVKAELKALVWPDAVVVEDHTLAVTLATVRKVLAAVWAGEDLIVTVPGRGYQFVAPVAVESVVVPATSTPPPPPFGGLPAPPDRLIGREADLAAIRDQFRASRLVTLTGFGGVGKTRLALSLAAEEAPLLPDGAWLVELAPLTDPQLVAEAVAAQFGLVVQDDRCPLTMLTLFLQTKRLLLVLDNCEHLIAEAARVADTVVRRCPGVAILATSRERLAVPGEFAYQVPPLDVPAAEPPPTADVAMGFGAVRLFVDRAAAVLGAFDLTDATAPVVAEICRRLDGLPLAIALAAGRLPLMAPAELLAQLDGRFRLLADGGRMVEPRHQALSASIDWSYGLLAEPERQLLRRLSVFGGSFSVALAAAVAGAEEAGIVGQLAALVDKTLVLPERAAPQPADRPSAGLPGRRFRLLESTRAYGQEKLAEAERADCLRRLAKAIDGWYAAGQRAWATMATETWRATWRPDLENLRVALDWAFTPGGDPALGVRLVGHSYEIWRETSLLTEQRRWHRLAEAHAGETPAGTAVPAEDRARFWLASARRGQVGQRQYLAAAQWALALFRQQDDPFHAAVALLTMAILLLNPVDFGEAEGHLREALDRLRGFGRTKFLVTAYAVTSVIRWNEGDQAAARTMLGEAHDLAIGLGDLRGANVVALTLAEIDFASGARDAAVARARSVLAACARDDHPLAATASTHLAGYLLSTGDRSGGHAAARDGLQLALALGADTLIAVNLHHLAAAAAIDGDAVRAAHLLGYGDSHFRGGPASSGRSGQIAWQDLLDRLAAALSPAALAELMAEGARWSEEEAMTVALGGPGV